MNLQLSKNKKYTRNGVTLFKSENIHCVLKSTQYMHHLFKVVVNIKRIYTRVCLCVCTRACACVCVKHLECCSAYSNHSTYFSDYYFNSPGQGLCSVHL